MDRGRRLDRTRFLRPIFRRSRWRDHDLSRSIIGEVIFIKECDFTHKRQQTLFQKGFIACEQIIIVEQLTEPTGTGYPINNPRATVHRLPRLRRGQCRYKNTAAAIQLLRILLVVREIRFVEVEDTQCFVIHATWQCLPIVHQQILVDHEEAIPGRGIVTVPDALQIGWHRCFIGAAHEQIAPIIGHLLQQLDWHRALVCVEQQHLVGRRCLFCILKLNTAGIKTSTV